MLFTVVSQNIMGTPAMSYKKVKSDLNTVRARGSVIGLQEMRWLWYWAAIRNVFDKADWGRYPRGFRKYGSAQPILWKKSRFTEIEHRTIVLHGPMPKGISGRRYINAVLLQDIETGIRFWVTNRHYLPGAWSPKPHTLQHERKNKWLVANATDLEFLRDLGEDGVPIIILGDFNRKDFDVVRRRVLDREVEYVGPRGVDYVAIVAGERTRLLVTGETVIPESTLNTDHPGRQVVVSPESR